MSASSPNLHFAALPPKSAYGKACRMYGTAFDLNDRIKFAETFFDHFYHPVPDCIKGKWTSDKKRLCYVEDIDPTLVDNLDGNLVKPCDNNAWIQLSSIRSDIYGGPRIRANLGEASSYYYLPRIAIFMIGELEDKDIGGQYYFLASLNAELNQTGFEEKAAIYALLYMESVDEFEDQHFAYILSSFGLEDIDLNCFAIWDDPSIKFGRVIQRSAYQSCKGMKR